MLVFYQTVKSRQFNTQELSEAYCLSMVDFRKPLFDPGACAATPAALDAIEEAGLEFMELLNRHVTGDWGDLDEHDNQANETALEKRPLSGPPHRRRTLAPRVGNQRVLLTPRDR